MTSPLAEDVTWARATDLLFSITGLVLVAVFAWRHRAGALEALARAGAPGRRRLRRALGLALEGAGAALGLALLVALVLWWVRAAVLAVLAARWRRELRAAGLEERAREP